MRMSIIFIDKPSPPQDVTVTEVTSCSATVTWKAPEDDGGSPVSTYVIERQDTKRGTWMNAGTVRVSSVYISTSCEYLLASYDYLL